jgi:hypothetical protein
LLPLLMREIYPQISPIPADYWKGFKSAFNWRNLGTGSLPIQTSKGFDRATPEVGF